MGVSSYRAGAFALGIALAVSAAAAEAQDTTRTDSTVQDSTRRARSSRVIPVRKDFTTRTSAGEVMLNAQSARIDSLELSAAADRQRLDSINSVAASAAARAEENARALTALQDSMRTVTGQLTTQLNDANTRVTALNDSVTRLGGDIRQLRNRLSNGSVFGNSGFYVGIGSGANFTNGTLRNIGYREGLNITIPIGWNKRGNLIGIRGELGAQTFDGRSVAGFSNPDPELYTANAMLALHFPFNQAKTHNFYVGAGGGVYRFSDFGTQSTLARRLDNENTNVIDSDAKTKFGVVGAAGLEFHVLGATSLFVEGRFTNVFVDESTVGGDSGKNLRWVPLVLGIQIR
jgi:hypothetical protein